MLAAQDYMARALFHAARGRGRTSPNPLVGAVVVSADGVVVGQGYHQRAGEAHAEVRALDEAGVRARGATLYSTLEPCCHVGRTGPCVARIVEAGIVRVVAALQDPDPRVAGRGFEYLRSAGVAVDVGVGAEPAAALNAGFLMLVGRRRPFVTLKAALSFDGCLAEAPGRRTQLTSAQANRHAHRVRAEVDAIGIGVGTVLVDDPELTVRGVYRERPLTRVVFDRRLRTPVQARLLSTADTGPVIIVTTAAAAAAGGGTARNALERRGAQIEVIEDGSIASALVRLGERGIGTVLLEGGAALHRAAWDEGAIDHVRLYVTPHRLGSGGLRFLDGEPFLAARLCGRTVRPMGPDVLIEGYVYRAR